MTDYGVDGFFFDGAGPHEFPAGDYVAYDRTAEPTDLARAFQMMSLEVPFQQVREAWKMGGLPVMSTLRDKGPRWSEMRRCVTDMIAAGQLGYPFVVAARRGGSSLPLPRRRSDAGMSASKYPRASTDGDRLPS